MNALTFQFKRIHLSAVAFGRRMFRGTKEQDDPDFDGVVDMTPARFDILYLIHGRGRFGGAMAMATLRAQLGLSRATISKAIKRLMELGLVTTEELDGRSKLVILTNEGVARTRRALGLVFTGRKLSRHIRAFFAEGRFRRHLVDQIDQALDDTWALMTDVAKHFGDTSDLVYLFRRTNLAL